MKLKWLPYTIILFLVFVAIFLAIMTFTQKNPNDNIMQEPTELINKIVSDVKNLQTICTTQIAKHVEQSKQEEFKRLCQMLEQSLTLKDQETGILNKSMLGRLKQILNDISIKVEEVNGSSKDPKIVAVTEQSIKKILQIMKDADSLSESEA